MTGLPCAFALLLALGLLAGGCSRNPDDPAPAATAPDEALPSLQASFQDGPADLKGLADGAVGAIQSRDDPAAYLRLEELSKHPDLTSEQRQALTKAWMAVNRRLAVAATNGNAAAQELLNRYRSTK